MVRKKTIVLFGVLAFAAVATLGGWIASSRIETPEDAAARTAPPAPSPVLVPVEERVLSSNIVTRGTARFGLPQAISIAPSALKPDAGLIVTLPVRNTQFAEGSVMLTASGRPVFILQGAMPAYRDLVPGISGDDVRQLEQGLERLGFDPGPVDGTYDQQTSAAVAEWYKATGWDPFGPTKEQLANIRTLERDWGDAQKNKLATAAAAAAAILAVDSARATAERNNRAAAAELAAREAEWRKLIVEEKKGTSLSVESARATAENNNRAAEVELAAQIADRALIVLDPRQPQTARETADAKLELARAAAERTRLEGELAVQAAESNAELAPEQFRLAEATVESARAAVRSARLEGEIAVQAALDAEAAAKFDAKLAADQADRLAADLDSATRKLGVQVPADEIVFIPTLPVRVEEVTASVGGAARGPVMSVTDNQLAIDSSLPLDVAPLVKPGMPVAIDEHALGVKATGVVEMAASTPGTRGVDGYHIYFEVRVDETSTPLEGFSLRLTIPIESTEGAVTAVPISALSLAADGTSRVQVENHGAFEYIVVEPGLSADGYVEVTPVNGTLAPGQLVVVGYNNPKEEVPQ
jgi:Putative peptidoglycan binding domain